MLYTTLVVTKKSFGEKIMEKQYCVSCGAGTTKGDSFCYTCGAKIVDKKIKSGLHSTPLNEDKRTDIQKPQEPRRVRGQSKQRRKRRIAATIVLGVILLPIITMTTLSSIRFEMGTLEYEIPDTGITSVNLDIYNDIGSISIYYDDSITNVFEATIAVRGGLSASMDDAVNFNHTIVDDQLNISFAFGNPYTSFVNLKSLNHDIEIYLNPKAAVSFNVETGTGSVLCYASDFADLVINDLHLATSTGSVEFYADDMHNLTLGDVSLESSTGSLDFSLSGSTNSSITGLTLACSTGSIDVHLGSYTTLNCSVIDISTSTGSIELEYTDIITMSDINWLISTSTGSIDVIIDQTILQQGNSTMDFDIETSTGSIEVSCELNDQIGIEMAAETGTGSIDLPNGYSYYISTEFAQKSNQYTFVINTSTGSITANVI